MSFRRSKNIYKKIEKLKNTLNSTKMKHVGRVDVCLYFVFV